MRFDVVTLFPELFTPFLAVGVTRRAFEQGLVEVVFHNPRDFADSAYRRVDDRPFGGGPGMVMMAEPLARTLEHIRSVRPDAAPVLLFSPQGEHLSHAGVARWSDSAGAVLVCGRYEGLDQRFVDAWVDEQISLGDFVLSGAELPAMVLLDAVARLQPGVLGDAQSPVCDSFHPQLDGLLDCPHYTRPEVWRGEVVPAVLTSGNHAAIARWRRDQSLLATAERRPELLEQARSAGRIDRKDELVLARRPAPKAGGASTARQTKPGPEHD